MRAFLPPIGMGATQDAPVLEMDDRDGIVAVHDSLPPETVPEPSDTTYLYSFIKASGPLGLDVVPRSSAAMRLFDSVRRDKSQAGTKDKNLKFAELKDAAGFHAVLDSLTARELEDLLSFAGFQNAEFARYLVKDDLFHKRLDGDGDLYYLKRRLIKTLKVLKSQELVGKDEYKNLVAAFKDPALSIWDMVTAELLLCYAAGPFVQHAARLAVGALPDLPGISPAGNPVLSFPTNPLMWAGYVLGGTVVSLIIGGYSDTFKYSWPVMTALRACEKVADWSGWQSAKDYIARPTPEFETPKNLTLEGAMNFITAKYRYLRSHFGGVAVEREYPKDFQKENKTVAWLRKNLSWMAGVPVLGSFAKSVSAALPDTAGETKAYNNNLFVTNVLAMVIFCLIQVSVNAVTLPSYDPTLMGIAGELGKTALNAALGWGAIGCVGNLYIGMNSDSANRTVMLRQIFSVALTTWILAVMIPELSWVWQQGLVLAGGAVMLYGVTKFVPQRVKG